ncbi:RNA-binding protein spenito-like [Mytilus californianus]|uniref:RNA-binding protein spenito-like n=1 Tax=Mytilus californianus TaxID=6549 RepID=UPI00224560B3|nr:RNA-binding protein spenito-like [Mytilus californianus]
MKRSPIRDHSPISKRSRSSYRMSDHDMGRGMSPDMYDRRDPRRDMVMKKSYRNIDHEMDRPRAKYRDDRMDYSPPSRPDNRQPDFRSICISNISGKIPVPVLKETLYHEFKKFGEFNVNVTYSGDIRVAYINFRYPEDARESKHLKSKLVLFDRPVRIEAVYQKKRSHSPGNDNFHYERHDNYGSSSNYRGRGSFRGYPSSRRPSGRGFYQGPPRNMPPRENPEFNQGDSYNAPKRNDKFPYHLDHIQPEDDENATRTLFVGNLDYNISEQELKTVFGRYGTIEDTDIKRPQRGTGNAYAFIKFINLDCAHKAKVEQSGQYIGRFQCKIGYGKVTATTCLWVGGLGSWITHETLEQEFDRFGMINRIEWPRGKDYAYVLYDNLDAAQAACQEMRGAPMGGTDNKKRLRVDFADPNHIMSPERGENNGDRDGTSLYEESRREGKESRTREEWRENDNRNPDIELRHSGSWDEGRKRPLSPDDYRRRKVSTSPDQRFSKDPDSRGRSREKKSLFSQERELGEIDPHDDSRKERKNSVDSSDMGIENVTSIPDLAKCLPVAWNGAVILKNSAFPARMHVVSGNVTIVDTLMRDPNSTETPVLKVKQRLRLDQPKLEDVGKRVSSAGKGGHCILLAMTSTLQNYEDPSVQQRPLKNLVSYLKQKEAAGVISLPSYESKDKDDVGVLYAFPPCEFGYKFLTSKATHLPSELVPDDYMVIVVVTGAGSLAEV